MELDLDEDDSLCEKCDAINVYHLYASPRISQPLNPVHKLETQTCYFCRYISQLLAIKPGSLDTFSDGAICELKYLSDHGSPPELLVGRRPIARIHAKDNYAHDMPIIPSLQRHLDLNLVRKWLQCCEQSHTECHDNMVSDNYKIYLIDVNRLCLTEGSVFQRYFGLSYVVGGKRGLELTTKNKEMLFRDKALSEQNGVPRVIQDAIELLRSLGEQFLWADSLCIVQDSETKHSQIMNMDLIYSQAFCTIVNVSGEHAESPLPGVSPRPVVELETRFKDATFIAQPPDLSDLMASSAYDTRGWTFQERILSPRCLLLTNWQAYFHCRENVYSEYVSNEKVVSVSQNPLLQRMLWKSKFKAWNPSWVPDTALLQWLQQTSNHDLKSIYMDMAEEYSSRKLTFKADKLNAFQGIASAVGKQYETGFIHGLPERALGTALLWVKQAPIPANSSSNSTEKGFPSWSWASSGSAITYFLSRPYGNNAILYDDRIKLVGNIPDADMPAESLVHDQVLSFSTKTVAAAQFQTETKRSGWNYHVTKIYLNSIQCGFIAGIDVIVYQRQRAFIEISRSKLNYPTDWTSELFTPQELQEGRRDGFLTPAFGEFLDSCHGSGHVANVVNVMLIEWKENGEAERVSVGVIREDEWDRLQKEEKLVHLV